MNQYEAENSVCTERYVILKTDFNERTDSTDFSSFMLDQSALMWNYLYYCTGMHKYAKIEWKILFFYVYLYRNTIISDMMLCEIMQLMHDR